jgi:hypothetical protein
VIDNKINAYSQKPRRSTEDERLNRINTRKATFTSQKKKNEGKGNLIGKRNSQMYKEVNLDLDTLHATTSLHVSPHAALQQILVKIIKSFKQLPYIEIATEMTSTYKCVHPIDAEQSPVLLLVKDAIYQCI